MFIDMLCSHEFDKVDLSSLQTGIMAGSPCPIETMKEVRDKMNLHKMTVSVVPNFTDRLINKY